MAAASYLFSTLSRPSLAAGLFSQREKDGLNWQLGIAFFSRTWRKLAPASDEVS